MSDENWYFPKNTDHLISPALLFYPDRIRHNIEQMIRISGDPGRLWTHVKTHKNAEIIGMQIEAGIDKFKCSTLSEAELLGRCGAKEALLAMQPTNVHLETYLKLAKSYPGTGFSTLVDNGDTLTMIGEQARASGRKIRLWLDINNGMNRTGIIPGAEAVNLFESMNADPWSECLGIHVYDGHIHDPELEIRARKCQEAMQPVLEMLNAIASRGLEVEKIIAGGSPTFALHAENKDLDLSPGTTLLWDAGYGKNYPDLPFKPAAALLSRVVSKPSPGMACADLGHKSVASEMGFPRIHFLNLDSCDQISQSEEHLVLRCENTEDLAIGSPIFALPLHICPTVAKYDKAAIVVEDEIDGSWSISARNHDPTGIKK
jgi:D-serine deaminase-like pyridoxal phosphate-dependent protein